MKEMFSVGSRRYWIEVGVESDTELRRIRVESEDGLPPSEFEVRPLARSGPCRTLEFDGRIEVLLLTREGRRTLVERKGQTFEVLRLSDRDKLRAAGIGDQDAGLLVVRAHMAGKIIRLLRQPDEEVEAGDGLMVIEAMKMQNQIKSPKSGVVVKYRVRSGDNVNAGDPLCEVES